jgi:hypothetical protein
MKLDDLLPRYDFNEIHKLKVKAPAQAVFEAMKSLRPAELSPLLFLLLNLRNLPALLAGKGRAVQA